MWTEPERQNLRHNIRDAAANHDARTAVRVARNLLATTRKPSDAMFCSSIFSGIARDLAEQLGTKQLKTFVVRSVTVEPILPFLATEAVFQNYYLDLQLGGYGSYIDDLLNPAGPISTFKPELVLVLLDSEEIAGRLPDLCANGTNPEVEGEIETCVTRMTQMLKNFRSGSAARIVFQGLTVPDQSSLGDVGDANLPYALPGAVTLLNRRLAAMCRAIPDCVFFDVDRLAARHGRAQWLDTRMFLASRLQVSGDCFRAYAHGLVRSFSSLFRAPRKVLITDLDNTLWGGVLGEDGADGIQTGSAFPGNCYREYQKYLKRLSDRGVLLAISSKNNEADVREAFQLRSTDLALRMEDFVACKISWQDKSESLRELAQELSLGLDSFVFVDDNPVECEAIRQQLPEVAVVAAPLEDPWKLVELLSAQPFFDAATVSSDDVNRLNEYKAQAKRAELEKSTGSRDEFLASLEIVCTFKSALQAPLSRAVQLLSKTNQFNLTTRRRSAAEVEEFAAAEGGQAVVVRVRDRFGDAGVVGLALARHHRDVCYIDSFLLSCRVIGRGIESALLAHLAKHALQSGAKWLVGEFIPTKKNILSENFYPEHGFVRSARSLDGSPSSVFYEIDLAASVPTGPQWITVEGNETNELSTSAALSS